MNALAVATDAKLPTFEHEQTLAAGFHFPARMTALPLGGRQIALVSPIPLDGPTGERVDALGDVAVLVAPNALHHLHLVAAKRRYPRAKVFAPARVGRLHAALQIDGTLEDAGRALRGACEVLPVEGAPSVEEHAFFHRATRTLVLTDLVFNVMQPRGAMANVVLFMAGCRGRLAQSRAWRAFFVKDLGAARASVRRILELPFERVVLAHGADVQRTELSRALAWMSGG